MVNRQPLAVARTVVATSALLALCGIVALVFGRIYSGTMLEGLLVGAVVAAVAIAVVQRITGVSTTMAVLTSLVALVGYLLLAVALTKDAADQDGTLTELFVDAVRNSGVRILTSTIPILPTPDTVVLPIALLWMAAALGAEILLRTRAVLVSFAAPLLAYIAALVLVGPNAPSSLGLATVYAAVAAVGLIATGLTDVRGRLRQLTDGTRRSFQLRRAAVVGGGLVALVAVTALLGGFLAGLSDVRPSDPRTRVSPPEQQLPEANPLARLAGWARNPTTQLFNVTVNEPSRLSWVVLSEYDGRTWLPGTRYRSAGSVLPVADKVNQFTDVEQRIEISGLDGLWLPVVDQAAEINGVRVSYDDKSGTVLQPEGLDSGLSYSVKSHRPDRDVAQLSRANVPSGRGFNSYLNVPEAPDDLRKLAFDIGERGSSAFHKALLLEKYLKENYTFSSEAPSGHGYPNLRFFLLKPEEEGGARGTSEQFATSFALLARILGLPTRVVVGFHAGTSVGANDYIVRTGDAFAWPEVYLANHGWVAFDPTPQGADQEAPAEQATSQAQQQDELKQSELAQLDKKQESDQPGTQQPKQAADDDSSIPLVAMIGVFVAVVLAGVLITVLVARSSLRRRRLGGGMAADRILGAWHEVRDAMRLVGRAPPADMAAREVALFAAEPMAAASDVGRRRAGAGRSGVGPRLPAPPPKPLPSVLPLADLVNMVAFAPGLAETTDAGAARRLADAYISAVRARQPWWRRYLAWWLDPRPLWWAGLFGGRAVRRSRSKSRIAPPLGAASGASRAASSAGAARKTPAR